MPRHAHMYLAIVPAVLLCLCRISFGDLSGPDTWTLPLNCEVGRDGASCEIDHVPSCRLSRNDRVVPPWHAGCSCQCLKEWKAFLGPIHTGIMSYGGWHGWGQPCYDVSDANAADACPDDPSDACPKGFFDRDGQVVPYDKSNFRHIEGMKFPAEQRLCEPPSATRALSQYNAPPESSPAGVCGDGYCEPVEEVVGERWVGHLETRPTGTAKCSCPFDRRGKQCEQVSRRCLYCAPSVPGDGSKCVNDCSGHGSCRGYTCQCDAGYGGIDCSISAANGEPWGVNVHTGLRKASRRPAIYVLELPARYTTHWVFGCQEKWGQDSQRLEGFLLLQAVLRSQRRTMDPRDAAFFFMPVWGGHKVKRLEVYEEARRIYGPALDRAQVLWPVMCHDDGPSAYAGVSELIEKYGDRNIFVSCHGLHKGYSWQDVAGSIRPGVDIVVPELSYITDPHRGAHLCDFFHNEPRGTKMYYSGSVKSDPRESNVRLQAQRALGNVTAQRPDIMFVTLAGAPADHLKPAQNSVFCLSLNGKNGGYATRDVMGMLEGCLPIFGLDHTSFIFEEVFPPETYALRVEQAQFGRLVEMVDHVTPERLRKLRHAATKACMATLPPAGMLREVWELREHWREGSDLDDDGNYVSSIFRVLEKRPIQ